MQPFERKFSKSTRIFLLLTNFFFFLEQKVGVFIEGGGGGVMGRDCFAVQAQTEVGGSPILLNCHRIQAVQHSF